MDKPIPHVDDLTVTVLALKVGKKQFTKQLFTQLPQMDFCGEGGRIREGVKPWGVVRPDGKRFEGWLIYDLEGVLHRSKLIQTRSQEEIDREKRRLEQEGHSKQYLDFEFQRLDAEPERAKHHAAMALLPQLFIGV